MLQGGFIYAVLLVLIVNGLFLYIYLGGVYDQNQFHSTQKMRNILTDSIATDAFINHSTISIRQKQLKIIYYKTHKTASTTVGNIIFRLGAQHGAQFLPFPEHYYNFSTPSMEVDITLNHHRPLGYKNMMTHYKQLVPQGKFLTVLREPTRRYLSHYHYYEEPNGKSLKEFFGVEYYRNFLSKDLGIWDQKQMDDFMIDEYDKFTYLITEKLDESLLLLKNAWGWTLQDILYVKLNDACKKGINYARMKMSCRPKYENLTAAEMQQMKRFNSLDIALYNRALNETNAALARQPQSFWAELELFRHIRAGLQETCTGTNKTIPELCAMYTIDDARYEMLIRKTKSGFLRDYPVSTVNLKL